MKTDKTICNPSRSKRNPSFNSIWKTSVSKNFGMCPLSFDNNTFCESLLLKFCLVMFHSSWATDVDIT